jgi:hypothetical protein
MALAITRQARMCKTYVRSSSFGIVQSCGKPGSSVGMPGERPCFELLSATCLIYYKFLVITHLNSTAARQPHSQFQRIPETVLSATLEGRRLSGISQSEQTLRH